MRQCEVRFTCVARGGYQGGASGEREGRAKGIAAGPENREEGSSQQQTWALRWHLAVPDLSKLGRGHRGPVMNSERRRAVGAVQNEHGRCYLAAAAAGPKPPAA